MLATFLYAAEAVLPLVLVIFLGYLLRRIGFFTDHFLSVGYKFSFRIALPAMLFCTVYSIKGFESIDMRTVVYSLLVIAVLFVLGTVAVFLWVPDKKQRGVVVQCFFRSNSAILGVSLTEALGGTSALQCVAVLTAFTIPMFNVLAVVALSVFNEESNSEKKGIRAIDWKKIGINILKNPLIIAIAAGLLCVAVRQLIPAGADGTPVFMLSKQGKILFSVVESMSKIASPFMLMMLGGQFTFSAVKGMKGQIILGTVGRIVLAPVLAIGVGYLLSRAGILSLGSPEYASFIALFASPVAVSSAIMAREMKNDDTLAGQLVVWTSLGSVITLFLFAFAFRSIGLL